MKQQIIAVCKLVGGKHISAKNADRIIARSTEPTDKWGNRLNKDGVSPIFELRNQPPYFQRWIIKKEKEGYCFREVSHGGGICGAFPTVRGLVMATCQRAPRIIVEVELSDEPKKIVELPSTINQDQIPA